ncbi:class I SAM-dependent methyltransferase [Erythrobacter mangrovi]|uniref:Class I SAM-dependent methyltransferase n=1 Tax=Erythrobacter mangrovi TaxID=2739433 RepID=A0A7D4AST3_9SPHN|nr:class I SAM-dependent methyltransferase [Erythrobacter mangrovi]QKG70377.1 class I SAM-dependent methyltransferase [Erythrobacter mangrovi]
MRNAYLTLTATIAIAAMVSVSAHATEPAANEATITAIANSVATSDRPEEARKLDEGRKPAEVLAFLGLEQGMAAADLIPGEGYWTEIMAHAVAPGGSVTALQPEQFYNSEKDGEAWSAMAQRAPGIALERYPFEAFAYAADSFDFAIMNLNYHDLYWESERYKIPLTDPDAYVRALYVAMKPGGIVGVIDHVGEGNDTRALVDKLHRIDPAVVRADFERAGFVLEAESDLLANPDDDHTKGVFDASIRGKTDRFLMKFRKPR